MPNGRCRIHGGKSLGGIASPSLKTGRYSKYLPDRLTERYLEASKDADLLALRDEIALTDARLSDVLERVDTGEAGRLWQLLKARQEDFMIARAKGSVPDMTAALTLIQQTIQDGIDDYVAWDDASKLIEQRRRLVETERKRLVDMQQMITAEKAMLLVSAVLGVIRTHVTDRVTLAAIGADIRVLTAIETGG